MPKTEIADNQSDNDAKMIYFAQIDLKWTLNTQETDLIHPSIQDDSVKNQWHHLAWVTTLTSLNKYKIFFFIDMVKRGDQETDKIDSQFLKGYKTPTGI